MSTRNDIPLVNGTGHCRSKDGIAIRWLLIGFVVFLRGRWELVTGHQTTPEAVNEGVVWWISFRVHPTTHEWSEGEKLAQ